MYAPLKLLFLDIDGVFLNSDPFLNDLDPRLFSDPVNNIDPRLVALLNKVIETTGAKVVLSSAWRLDSVVGFNETVGWLKHHGFTGEVIDHTPDLSHLGLRFRKERAKEIHAWLDDLKDQMAPHDNEVRWAVLDDNFMDILPSSRFVQTNPMNGLTQENVDRVTEILMNAAV